MPKSRENGTSFSDSYEYTRDEEEYRTRNVIFDQLTFLKRIESEKAVERRFVLLGKKDYRREEVMAPAVKIVSEMEKRKIEFIRGEAAFMQPIHFWGKELRRRTFDEFSAEDATRAAMFACSMFYESRHFAPEGLKPKMSLDVLDANFQQAIRYKGMRERRYEKYRLKELESQLRNELGTVISISSQYFPGFVSDVHAPQVSQPSEEKETPYFLITQNTKAPWIYPYGYFSATNSSVSAPSE